MHCWQEGSCRHFWQGRRRRGQRKAETEKKATIEEIEFARGLLRLWDDNTGDGSGGGKVGGAGDTGDMGDVGDAGDASDAASSIVRPSKSSCGKGESGLASSLSRA